MFSFSALTFHFTSSLHLRHCCGQFSLLIDFHHFLSFLVVYHGKIIFRFCLSSNSKGKKIVILLMKWVGYACCVKDMKKKTAKRTKKTETFVTKQMAIKIEFSLLNHIAFISAIKSSLERSAFRSVGIAGIQTIRWTELICWLQRKQPKKREKEIMVFNLIVLYDKT